VQGIQRGTAGFVTAHRSVVSKGPRA
jgi:hypothetical protein